MTAKIIASLIVLSLTSLIAHENFNQITANVDSVGLDSSHLKFNHQSHFYIPSGDVIILDLVHGLHRSYMQNNIGVAYRTFLTNIGIGANFFYMHSTEPKLWMHQFSPGLELLYKNWQVSYNFYLPTSFQKHLKKTSISHSAVSEVGLRYTPFKEFSIGLLPFYDHSTHSMGVTSRISYTLNDRFEFGLSPYYKPQGGGVTFHFGVNFGPEKGVNSVHRSNEFNYQVRDWQPKNPQIFIEVPKAPVVKEEDRPQEPEKEPKTWRDFFHIPNYKDIGDAKKEKEQNKEHAAVPLNSPANDFFFMPPFEYISSPLIPEPDNRSGSFA